MASEQDMLELLKTLVLSDVVSKLVIDFQQVLRTQINVPAIHRETPRQAVNVGLRAFHEEIEMAFLAMYARLLNK